MEREEKFLIITDINSIDFHQSMDIYIDSFEMNERQSVYQIKKRVQQKIYIMIVIKLGEDVIGFSLVRPFSDQKFCLLDYLAVKKEFRNRKFGSLLFNKLYKELIAVYPDTKLMVIEVDDPEYGNSKEKIIKVKRIKFYEKLGAKVVQDFRYYMPPMVEGAESTNMKLMIYSQHRKTILESNRLKLIVKSLYKQNYGKNEADIYLQKMLGSI